jgi:pimeloyl-ACP methyl ester carboxylesterase
MTHSTLQIDGIDVLVEGSGPSTVLMVHGFPDSHRLWDSTVLALHAQHRCVRFTLPGFDLAQGARATSLVQMTQLLAQIVDAVSPNQPVTLLLHDWGCVFGYEFAACHPDRVARVVGVDIGDFSSSALARSLTAKAKWQVFCYQIWLALAYKLGPINARWADRMTRGMARSLRCPTPSAAIGWQMNYPYAMQWLGLAGGLGGGAFKGRLDCPMLYIYGARKPFMFHSPDWLARLGQRADCAVQGLPTGHWVMVQQPEAFNQCVSDWLAPSA